jgi:hypothetical protein
VAKSRPAGAEPARCFAISKTDGEYYILAFDNDELGRRRALTQIFAWAENPDLNLQLDDARSFANKVQEMRRESQP